MESPKVTEPDTHTEKKTIDPLVCIVMNREIMKVTGELVSKLEYVRYDETRAGVFRTTWCNDLFLSSLMRLDPINFGPKYDINNWYHSVISKSSKANRTYYDIKPSAYAQSIETNWLLPLFEMEIKSPGFMIIMHNVLELEDSVHIKLAHKAKEETEYDFLSYGKRNAAAFAIEDNPKVNHPMLSHK